MTYRNEVPNNIIVTKRTYVDIGSKITFANYIAISNEVSYVPGEIMPQGVTDRRHLGVTTLALPTLFLFAWENVMAGAHQAKNADLWQMAAREGLRAFLNTVKLAEKQGLLETPESFAKVLSLGLNRLEINPADMAHEEEISKAAVSRWVNGKAIPPTPTRKHVINWLKAKAEARLHQLG